MSNDRVRSWTASEVLGRSQDEVVTQSDELTEALGRILFGKHPGAQFLSLVECATSWVTNHEENQDEHCELFIAALREFVELKQKQQHHEQPPPSETT